MSDASFKDGVEKPLRLIAHDETDLTIISAMIQDSIADTKEMLYEPERASFSLLIKRFRWEDVKNAESQKRPFERVQSVLMVQSVLAVQSNGFDKADDLSLELLSIRFENGSLYLAFAGDGELKLGVEAIDVILSDVSRPYVARAKQKPQHED